MANILITGANRGLGLAMVKLFLLEKNPPKAIIATCRNLEKSKELQEVAKKHPNVKIVQLDVGDFGSYENFTKQVSDIVKNEGLNVLINNAAIHLAADSVLDIKPEDYLETLKINSVAPVLLTKSLLNLLKKAAENNSGKPLGPQRALVINMSSLLGSISENTGGYYTYRGSKAALNMTTASLSVELKKDGIMVTSIHPGWVKTDMGGPNAPLEIDESISGVVKVITNLNETHNGGFYQWDGKQVAW